MTSIEKPVHRGKNVRAQLMAFGLIGIEFEAAPGFSVGLGQIPRGKEVPGGVDYRRRVSIRAEMGGRCGMCTSGPAISDCKLVEVRSITTPTMATYGGENYAV
jgi:hypothetical protein